ncbi:HNH endonuclease signature motif containing protein [Bacillus pseudomycoides]|uniref:HNH endonuclease signature motif containing protein n=1 Tax=Bacillus pseudomycoides TaxID=64104 RepID=UPI003D22E62C
MKKYQYFNDLKFTRDEKTGYYLNSTIRKRMHRYVWEFYNGEIPKGYHIHHIDHDKSNNDISNLELIEATVHLTMHAVEQGLTNYNKMVKNLNENARPKANEWHGSEDGHEWHKEQYKKYLKNFTENKVIKICAECEKEFETIDTKTPKFCSNKCKSKHRRKSGVDNVIRKCEFCNNEFTINKYSKTRFCSRKCMKSDYWKKEKQPF